jgi:hypothetical protein
MALRLYKNIWHLINVKSMKEVWSTLEQPPLINHDWIDDNMLKIQC